MRGSAWVASLGVAAGLAIGPACVETVKGHCGNLEGDKTCFERFGCCGPLVCDACVLTNDGCVFEIPDVGCRPMTNMDYAEMVAGVECLDKPPECLGPDTDSSTSGIPTTTGTETETGTETGTETTTETGGSTGTETGTETATGTGTETGTGTGTGATTGTGTGSTR